MYFKADTLDEMYAEIIKDELNVKEIEFTDNVRDFTSYSFKPQLKTLGRRFGKNINAVREILASLDGNEAMDELNSKGTLTITVEGVAEALTSEDLLVESAQKEGFEAASENGITVVLDTNLTPELINEGLLREIVSKVQTMRKEAGFEVMDHIILSISGNDMLSAVVSENAELVKEEVLADDITNSALSYTKEWNINGETVMLGVEKVK